MLRPRGRWEDWVRHSPLPPARRLLWLIGGVLLALGIMTGLERWVQKHRRAAGDGLRVIELSPAPESALPLTPFPGAKPDAEVEFRALLMRIPSNRQISPSLLSVHTLSGRLDRLIVERVGPHGEYELAFVPRQGMDGRHLLLSDFRFAPVGEAARRRGTGPEIILELETPRRIDPPMEPEEGVSLVLQITGRLSSREPGGP